MGATLVPDQSVKRELKAVYHVRVGAKQQVFSYPPVRGNFAVLVS